MRTTGEIETPTGSAAATVSEDIESRPTAATPSVERPRRIRTRYLIDWRTQLKGSLLSIIIVIGLLVVINLVTYYMANVAQQAFAPGPPDVAREIGDAMHLQQGAMLLLSICFLFGFIVLRTLETHRTAGAAANLVHHLAQLEGGHYNIAARLRRSDNLQALAAGINKVTDALQRRAGERIETLERLASRIQGLSPLADDAADDLQALIAREKQSLE